MGFYSNAISLVGNYYTRAAVFLRAQYPYIFSSDMSWPIQQQRLNVIQTRLRLLIAVMALIIPAWGGMELFVFPHDLWLAIFKSRLLAGGSLALYLCFGDRLYQKIFGKLLYTYVLLGIVFIVPMMLYIFCVRISDPVFDNNSFALAIGSSYAFFPFVILTCIGFFPLTLIETLCIITPFLTSYYLTTPPPNAGPWSPDFGTIWTMALLAIASVVICYSQLHTLIQLISYSSYDLLTNCLGRRSGEEVVRALWHYSIRKKTHFAIAFVDLDHFKQVNDGYSHQAGDKVLANTASAIRTALRKNDFIIRWGGEEFLVILPDANLENAVTVMRRVAEKGFGLRPDGSPQTVSIGIAERISEDVSSEDQLIQIADNRLYEAKTSGRSRIVGSATEIVTPQMQENLAQSG